MSAQGLNDRVKARMGARNVLISVMQDDGRRRWPGVNGARNEWVGREARVKGQARRARRRLRRVGRGGLQVGGL